MKFKILRGESILDLEQKIRTSEKTPSIDIHSIQLGNVTYESDYHPGTFKAMVHNGLVHIFQYPSKQRNVDPSAVYKINDYDSRGIEGELEKVSICIPSKDGVKRI